MLSSIKVILRDQPNDKEGNRRRQLIRFIFYLSIVAILGSFIIIYLIAIIETCPDYLKTSE